MKWDEYFFELCETVAKKSKDTSTKMGAIFVGKNKEIKATGFNGFPKGVKDDVSLFPERYERPDKYIWTEHSERNAIAFAARNGVPLDGCTVYLTWAPCAECVRMMIQCGVVEIVVKKQTMYIHSKSTDKARDEMW